MSPSRKSPPSAVVGLDIGSDSIKITEAKYGKDGITLTGLGVAPTPEGTIENEVILDPVVLGGAIKALITECGIKTRKCVSSVGGQSQVVVRVIEVPKMTPAELSETMKWEIERHVPFSANEVVKDFQPLDRPEAPDAQNMEVLLAVAQQDLITRHVETLQAAGLKPMAIDIEPLAESRSLVEAAGNGAKDGIVAIVNIGSNRTDVDIFENGCLVFPSPPLAIAGNSITREISEALGQTPEEAEATKREYAAVDIEALSGPVSPQDMAQAAPAEPTAAFSTVFDEPATIGASAFDSDPADAPTAPEGPQFTDFTTTVDGPVFDMPEDSAGPAFDQPAAPAGPVFDLGDEPAQAQPGFDPVEPLVESTGPAFGLEDSSTGEAVPAASAYAFDLGGDEPDAQPAAPVVPDFDLEDAQPEPVVDSSPVFDLGDGVDEPPVVQPVFTAAPAAIRPQPGSMEHEVFGAISGVIVDLATEIRRSIEYYTNRYSKMPEKVYLCGGTAKMPRLAEFLSQELGLPVEVADPVRNVQSKVPGASDQYLREISPLFAVSIGLAIRDMIG